jgi:aminopeptidase
LVRGLLGAEELERYADAIVKVGLGIGRGDDLMVTCQPAHREFAVAVVESAYRAHARSVDVEFVDPLVRAAYLSTAPEKSIGHVTPWRAARTRATVKPETATLFVAGESDPGALDKIPGKRIAADLTATMKRFTDVRRASRLGKRRWAIAAWPTPAWAEVVYPGVASETAQRKLARDLLSFCRVGPKDPPGLDGLRDHLTLLRSRAARLTKLKLETVHLRGPGTDLTVALHQDGIWVGGGSKTYWGKRTAPNLPTEECFTSPEAGATEGTFRCSRPLMFQGRVIDEISGEFHRGRLVKLNAKRAADRDFLADYLFAIKNADRLGEIALVDASSRIGQSRRIFYNTLLDENAAAHIAVGSGFTDTRKDHQTNQARRGVNRSQAHLDVMIGTDDFEAYGSSARRKRVPLIADGTWQI